ncbi:MAG: SDR family NAD(P)-dependent oxidoreductase [Myxococcota bacterium]
MKHWRDAVAFVTGGSSGIGLAAAERLGAAGAHVALFARRVEPLAAAKASVLAAGAASVHTFALDVTDDPACRQTLATAVEQCGAPRLLVHAAGQAWPSRFADLDYAGFDRTIKTNLYGTFSVVSSLVPAMREHGGHVVTVSSVAGVVGVYGMADYCASKFGVIGLSEALRQELDRDGINVSVLCPPDTDTPGLRAENEVKPAETKALSGKASVMSAGAVADAMLRGVARRDFLIIPGADGKLTHLAKRLWPGLVHRIMMRTVRSGTT